MTTLRLYGIYIYIYRDFCNGFANCRDGTDEANCPNCFYCKSSNIPGISEITEKRLSKFFFLILFNVLCWLPTLIQMILSLFDKTLPLTFQEFIGIFFSPIIAIFKPILHSEYQSGKAGGIVMTIYAML